MIGKIFSADNIRMAVFLFTLTGAMWTLTNRLEGRMDARFDKIEARLDRIDTRLDSFGEHIAKNEARLDASE